MECIRVGMSDWATLLLHYDQNEETFGLTQ